MKPKEFPRDLYMVIYPDGSAHWFREDPLQMSKEQKDDNEIDIATALSSFFGEGSVENPLRVRLLCALSERCEPVNVESLMYVLQHGGGTPSEGEPIRKIIDKEGNDVEIYSTRMDSDPDFPLAGNVVNKMGTVIADRRYTRDGLCSDGDWEHDLVIRRIIPKK